MALPSRYSISFYRMVYPSLFWELLINTNSSYMSDTIDEINPNQGEFTKPIVFVLIGILFYNGLLYAEPTLLSVEYYFYDWGLPNHLHYWVIFLLKYFICLIIVNFAGNWIIKNTIRFSSFAYSFFRILPLF